MSLGKRLAHIALRKIWSAGETLIEIPADTLRPATGWPGGRQIFNVHHPRPAVRHNTQLGRSHLRVAEARDDDDGQNRLLMFTNAVRR